MLRKASAHRWFDLGFMDFQPSELGKLIMIIAFACFLLGKKDELNLKRNLLFAALYMAIPFVLIIIEPDLGTAMAFIVFAFAMAWVAGVSPRLIIIIVLIGVILLLLLFGMLYFATGGFQYLPEEGSCPLGCL